jgi:hypothetical protein
MKTSKMKKELPFPANFADYAKIGDIIVRRRQL